MKKILQNKLLIVFLIVFTLIGTICSSVYAGFVSGDILDITYGDTNYSFEFVNRENTNNVSDYKYFLLCLTSSTSGYYRYNFFFSNSNDFVFTQVDNKDFFTITSENGFYYSFNNFANYTSPYPIFATTMLSYQASITGTSSNIIYSNFDLKDNNGNVVFQGAPQGITQALVEQATQLGMKPLVGIKEIILVVIVTIVGLIAFWKAWQLLSKQLRKA